MTKTIYNYPVILAAVILQYVWAVALFIDNTALDTTGVHLLFETFSKEALIIGLFSTASSSFGAFFLPGRIATCVALVPQQILLLLSAIGAIEAMLTGTFADGTVRTKAFLLVDQSALVLLAFFHFWSIVMVYRYSKD